jgi:hypothetical protein
MGGLAPHRQLLNRAPAPRTMTFTRGGDSTSGERLVERCGAETDDGARHPTPDDVVEPMLVQVESRPSDGEGDRSDCRPDDELPRTWEVACDSGGRGDSDRGGGCGMATWITVAV